MKHHGFDPQGTFAAFQLNKTVTAYYKTDDPGEKNMKLILRGLKILFLMAWMIGVVGIYVIWKASSGA
jgi:hypothetical protein